MQITHHDRIVYPGPPCKGEPNYYGGISRGEYCVALDYKSMKTTIYQEGGWNDVPCEETHYNVVCEERVYSL